MLFRSATLFDLVLYDYDKATHFDDITAALEVATSQGSDLAGNPYTTPASAAPQLNDARRGQRLKAEGCNSPSCLAVVQEQAPGTAAPAAGTPN